MKDIIRAINIENEYIEQRLQGNEPYNLVDRIVECGFESLDDYFCGKLDYNLSVLNFNIYDRASDEGAQMTLDAIRNGVPLVVFGKAKSTNVYHGDESYNEEYCSAHHIPILDYNSHGGNIVLTDGDLAIGISIPIKEISSEYILEHLAGILSKYIADVGVDNNDIMVNGFKVAGSAGYDFDNGIGFVIHFSFSDKSDLISNICIDDGKEHKRVGYLSGITTDVLRSEVIAWLQKH